MSKRATCGPIISLFLMSLGGLLLHLRIHPPGSEAAHWIPAISGVASTFALPVMFYYRKTVTWAYLFTWAAVIVGTVTMADYSVDEWVGEVTLKRIILESTIADIAILWAKIPLAYMILRIVRPKDEGDAAA